MEAQKYKLRDARDSLIDILFYPLQTTYPIPDLPVIAEQSTVLFNASARIIIPFSQADVTYEVIDDSGSKGSKKITRTGDEVIIETNPLVKDEYTFSVIATKNSSGFSKQLLQTVIVKAGVNNALEVLLKEPVFEFGSRATVIVKDTQPGAKYQMYDMQEVALSDEVKSVDGGDIEIITTDPVTEDIQVVIWVTSIKTGFYDYLLTQPQIRVLPDFSIEPVLQEPLIYYTSKAVILLNNTQKSVEYQVIFEDIDDDDFDKEAAINKPLEEPVPGNGKTARLDVFSVKEDLTVSVLATKIESRYSGKLRSKEMNDGDEYIKKTIQVQPDTNKQLTVVEEKVTAGQSATIKVSNTQKGVLYQLRSDPDNTNIGKPGYHHKNYKIGKARIGIEFAIDTFNDDSVYLPTGPLEKTTTFNVLAIKATTKAEALIGKITVTVK